VASRVLIGGAARRSVMGVIAAPPANKTACLLEMRSGQLS